MKPDTIPELHVLDKDGSCIFTHGDRYEIPLYQRPYAWTEEHINQLIEDVKDIPEDGSQKYHLGSLVVYRKKDSLFEVIDGQQRLTTLYLLLTVLGIDLSYGENPTLAFSCRERSTYTLRHLRSHAERGQRIPSGISALLLSQKRLKKKENSRGALQTA